MFSYYLLLNRNFILYNPAIPTKAYIILLITDIAPKIVSTKLKSNMPINPQFMAPITIKIRANLSIIFMFFLYDIYKLNYHTLLSFIFY